MRALDERRVPFLACCTSGFDSAVALRALNGPRWLRGLPRYLLATLRELAAFRMWNLTVHSEGKPLRAGLALFASALNTPTFGSGIPITPHASINDGLLDLIVAGRFTRVTTLLMLPPIRDMTYAGLNSQTGEITSCLMYLPMPGSGSTTADFFNPQVRYIEKMIMENRAPYPILHIWREDSVAKAAEAYPEPDSIIERNIATMRELGPFSSRRAFLSAPSGSSRCSSE